MQTDPTNFYRLAEEMMRQRVDGEQRLKRAIEQWRAAERYSLALGVGGDRA